MGRKLRRLGELHRPRERLAAEREALRAGGGADARDEPRSRLELAWRERQLEAFDANLAADAEADTAPAAADDTRSRPEGKATP